MVGLVLALLSGMSVFLAAGQAMDRIWGVPFRRRPNPLTARGKALLLVLVLGAGVLAATALTFVGTSGSSYRLAWKAGSVVLSTGLAFAVFWAAYRVLTVADVGWTETWIGAAVAAVSWQLLQAGGSLYVEHVVKNGSAVYGTFAFVIGLLSWIYLASSIVLLAAEVNVVAERRLWPRSFSVVLEEPVTTGDVEALSQRAEVEERRSDQRIATDFEQEDPGSRS